MRLVKGLLDRGLTLIELLAMTPNGRRLSDIAAELDLHRGPAHRLLSEITSLGWIEQDATTQHYRLTLKLALLGQQYLRDTGLPGVVQPVLDEAARRCGELVRLTVVQGNALHWFALSQGAQPGLMYQPASTGRPELHTTANGKVWLSTMNDEDAAKLAIDNGFGQPAPDGKLVAPKAIRRVEDLLKDLAMIRERGYALAVEEAEPGVKAIAVVVRDIENSVVGTISIAGPLLRMGMERDAEFYALLQQTVGTLRMVWPRPGTMPDAI